MEWLDLLTKGGPWALVGGSAFAIRWLVSELNAREKKIDERDERIFGLLDKQNEILSELKMLRGGNHGPS